MKVVMQRKRVHTIETFTQALAREVDLVISKYRDRLEDLETESIRHRCEFHRDRGRDADMPDRADVDVDTRKRWVGNYVRHCLTTYDDLVDSSYGAVGRHEAYDAMKALVSQRVSLLYA